MKIKKILLFYGEIGLKGKNKSFFINKLKGNIIKSTNKSSIKIISMKKEGSAILCDIEAKKKDIIDCFENIIGLKYFLFVEKVDKNIEILKTKFNDICLNLKKQKINEIMPQTKRSDKNFELNSPQINALFGEIANKYGIKINYKKNEGIFPIIIKINLNSIYISFEKHLSLSGLPVGSAGRVLVLLSGGIDSPVASFKLMQRGCNCDFLHIHNLKSDKDVLNSKIVKTIKKLNKFQYKSTLYVVNYDIFEFSTLEKIYPRYDLVVFKYYLLKLAEKIGKKYEYLAIANGDNLAQVASQTLENLNIVNYNIDLPIFRPLLTYEKEEIIKIADNKINTFELSCQEYKDCCSLVSKNPLTKAKKDKFIESLNKIEFDKLINKSFDNLSRFKII